MKFVLCDGKGSFYAGHKIDDDGHIVAIPSKDINDAVVFTLNYDFGVFTTTPNLPVIRNNTLKPVAFKLVAVE